MSRRSRPRFETYYGRQMVLKEFGKKGQRKLCGSSVAVVGLGGLGTVSSLYLALAGVGCLRLIDQDTVELVNLHRQILYTPADVGFPKAEVTARRLSESNPLVKVEAVPENVNLNNVGRLLSGVDCVVDGLDNMRTRYVVNHECVRLGIPYVFGAAIGMEGNLSVFASPETPCLECVLPNIEDDYLQTCDVRGVLGATPGIIGTMQAMEAIKVLAGVGSPLKSRLMICDFSDMYFSVIDVFKRKDCPICQTKTEAAEAEEKVVWLCGRNTANVNPDRPVAKSLNEVDALIRKEFKVHLRSKLAIIFDYKQFEVTFFKGGRMLIKNVDDEATALKVYREIMNQLED